MPVVLKDLGLGPPSRDAQTPGLFENLGENELQNLLSNASLHEFDPGKLLIQQGDPPKHLYYVISGALKTYRSNADGGEATIGLLKKGDTCMDAAIFMGGPSPVTVEVLEKCSVLLLPESFIKSYVLRCPQFAVNMLRIVTMHYKNAMQQVDSIVTKPPVQRLGYYLLKLHLEQGSDKLDISLPFKKSLIANYLGMTPETFSRTLKDIKNLGLDIDNEVISLRDAYALCHFCDADTAFVCSDEQKASCPTCPNKH
jgi:CRP/FNR family transcriptional regulator, dissimilatory nitrate respiration regulator